MKNLMRIISVLLAFAGVIIIIATSFNTGVDFTLFAAKILLILTANIAPIISIALCAYCMERNDTNYIVRIIPIYMSVPILLSIIMMLFETNASWLVDCYNFLSKTFLPVTALSFIAVIKPNNRITTILNYMAYGLLVLIAILTVLVNAKSYLLSNLPDAYGSSKYYSTYSSSVSDDNEFVTKMYSITTIAEVFIIILLYTTNYAFSDKIELETEDIDYEAVKKDAENAANLQMQKMYNPEVKQETTTNPTDSQGTMNISNQLGQDSNVGTVSQKAREVNVEGTSLDSIFTLSKNPIVNQGANEGENTTEQKTEQPVEQEPAKEEFVEQTTPPNLDIQQQMQIKIQNEQNTQMQAVAQQPTEQAQVQPQVEAQPAPVQNNVQNQLQQQIQNQLKEQIEQQTQQVQQTPVEQTPQAEQNNVQ